MSPEEQFGQILGVLIVFGLWALIIISGVRIAKKKNRSPHWMWFGIHPFAGLIMLIVLACLKPKVPQKPCPNCGMQVQAFARVCPYCAHNFPTST